MIKNSFGGKKNIYYDPKQQLASADLADFDLAGRKLNHEAIYDFLLYNIVLPPNSIFEGIQTLFPGEEYPALVNHEYQELAAKTKTRFWSAEKFARRLDEILQMYFDYTVSRDKPTALMLSGGIDSAIIASYLPKDTVCVTWGGWGEGTTDVVYSKKSFARFSFKEHLVCLVNYDEDEKLYRQALHSTGQLFAFTGAVPHLRMSKKLSEHFGQGQNYQLFMGQNADTISGAYRATEYAYYCPKISWATKHLPLWRKMMIRNRKWFLPSTDNPVELMAFFHSCGIFPGPWISPPEGYFAKKLQQVHGQIGRKLKKFRDHILMHQLMTEARRNQYVQNNLPPLYGATVATPYYHKEVVRLFMEIPFWIRARENFDKVVLKELARRRGVPDEVIAKGKKGLSYGYQEYIRQKRHLPVWDEMEHDKLLNEFVNVKMIRAKLQDNFPTYDLLMSLHVYLTQIA